MKHKLITTVILAVAFIINAAPLRSDDGETRINIPVDQPLSLDTYEISPFIFTTAGEDPHRAGITVTLAYSADTALLNEIRQKEETIRHAINILLGSKRYEDLDSFEDVIVLSDEIKAVVNKHLTRGIISEVYFWDFALE